jgi:hypothetical protein
MKTLLNLMLLSVFISHSQARVESEKLDFISKSEKLKTAIGWEKHYTSGDWVQNNNVINSFKTNFRKGGMYSQNFNWVQFATIENKGIKYYVLLFEKTSGRYKYPAIKEDWIPETQTHFFVLTVEQYNELKAKLDLNNGENITLKTMIHGFITDRYEKLNDANLLIGIRNSINMPYKECCFNFNAQKVDNQNVVRFLLPEDCANFKMYNLNIDTKYFEVNENEFKKILIE